MSARFLLIDGYNLLYAAGMGKLNYARGDLERCRGRLLRHLLAHLTPAEIVRTTLVFDSRDPPPDRPSRFVVSGLRIIFANPGGDADELIGRMLSEHQAPQQLTLISSDHVLQGYARRDRVKFLDSETFVAQLEQKKSHRPHHRKHGSSTLAEPHLKSAGQLSPAEVLAWIRYFGLTPEPAAPAISTHNPSSTIVTSHPVPVISPSEVDYWLREFAHLLKDPPDKG